MIQEICVCVCVCVCVTEGVSTYVKNTSSKHVMLISAYC
jgi:hypothetical protein